jgi:prepilin-type N-terminal cleavage/methylation domain-containing protein
MFPFRWLSINSFEVYEWLKVQFRNHTKANFSMTSALKFLQRIQRRRDQRSQHSNGFTLIELLVAMILAALVIGPLLAFMLNIVQTDRREQAKAFSEQEVQSALDYITQDLAQAIYIYDADSLARNSTSDPTTSGIKDQIPPASGAVGGCPNTANACVPVLVFWKREFLPDVVPVKNAGGTVVGQDDAYVYSLIAYYLVKDDSPNWSKAARITRFQIRDGVKDPSNPGSLASPNYITGQAPSKGFQMFDLSLPGTTLQEKMNRWKKGADSYEVGAAVLVDFVDQTTGANAVAASCPTNWSQTPPTIAGGFYACVAPSRDTAQVVLRGNAIARLEQSASYAPSQSIYFPISSIQVKGRGLLNGQ